MKKTSSARLISGAILVAVGILLLLSAFDVLSFGDLIRHWWPLIFVAIGVMIIVNDHNSYIWGAALALLGTLLVLYNYDILPISPWALIPGVVVLGIGAQLIFSKPKTGAHPENAGIGESGRAPSQPHVTGEPETLDATAVLSGVERKLTSTNFRGGQITAILGGAEIDLRNAVIADGAEIRLLVLLGGAELTLPPNVIVRNKTTAILGGVEDKGSDAAGTVLTISGTVILGGIDIKK